MGKVPMAPPLLEEPVLQGMVALVAMLGLKIMITHFLTARSRIMSNTFGTWADEKNDWVITTGFFAINLGAFGPDFGGKSFVEAAHSYCKNCAENEPFFVMAAFFAGMTRSMETETLAMCLTIYYYCRLAHCIFYFLGPYVGMSPRSFAWIGGQMTMGFTCYTLIASKA